MATNKVMKTVTTSGLDAHMRGPDKEEYIDTYKYMHIRHTTGGQTKDTHTHTPAKRVRNPQRIWVNALLNDVSMR